MTPVLTQRYIRYPNHVPSSNQNKSPNEATQFLLECWGTKHLVPRILYANVTQAKFLRTKSRDKVTGHEKKEYGTAVLEAVLFLPKFCINGDVSGRSCPRIPRT